MKKIRKLCNILLCFMMASYTFLSVFKYIHICIHKDDAFSSMKTEASLIKYKTLIEYNVKFSNLVGKMNAFNHHNRDYDN